MHAKFVLSSYIFVIIIISSNFIFNFTNFCVISTAVRAIVVAKLVKSGILFLISFILALRAAVVVKLVILGISPLTSFILELRVVLIAKLVIPGIPSSIFLMLAYIHLF